ncbi:hypothetical protein WA026_006453, partial [Henosepilachna vigintioctopunctata]
ISVFSSVFAVYSYLKVPIDLTSEVHDIASTHICPSGKYLFLISLREAKTMKHFCGGTLIKPNLVLTAAHCLISYESAPHSVIAEFGTIDLKKVGMQRRTASALYIHGNFYPTNFVNDIALILLKSDFDLKFPNILVKLPTDEIQDLTEVCKQGLLYGWVNKGEELSHRMNFKSLLKVNPIPSCAEVTIMSKNSCAVKINDEFDESFNCALRNVHDKCQEDSGGPLFCGDVQYGIMLSDHECTQKSKLIFYTRVDKYKGYINYIIQNFIVEKEKVVRSDGISTFNTSLNKLVNIFMVCVIVILKYTVECSY